MCAESHSINSGFGRYTAEILKRLSKRPDYEIAEFASYARQRQDDVPWKIYPNEVPDNHKDAQIYKSNPINQFGQWRFEKVVAHFKPDIVFDIRDYWMFSYQEVSPFRPYFDWVIAPTIDSIPQKPEWLTTFENADVVLTHTDWAGEYLKSQNRKINLQGTVSDSVDPNVFYPVNWTKRLQKAKYGVPTESFVIGSVMRNQKRKLIAELFLSLKELIDQTGNQKIFLYLHTSYPEAQGWNLPELLQEYGVYNNVLFTYYSPSKKKFYVSPFKGVQAISPEDPSDRIIFPNVVYGVDNDQLREIYNIFDIYVQYAICEGLGIPQLEAASCGIPIFAVNYSGMEELTSKLNGVKLDHILLRELETQADRAVPFNDDLISKIISWMEMSDQERKNKSRETRKLLVENYSWDKTAHKLMEVFDAIEPKNRWDQPLLTDPSIGVPDKLSNRDFVYFIIDQLLLWPELKNSYLVQSLVRSLDEKLVANDNEIMKATRSEIVKNLEVILNNKIYCEKLRSGEVSLSEFDFLNE